MKTYRISLVLFILQIIIDIILMSIFIGFFTLILHIADYFNNELLLTNKSVIIKTGWLVKSHNEIPFSKVNNITVRQGPIGRIFNYGDVIIFTGNDIAGLSFKGVENPIDIRNRVNENIN